MEASTRSARASTRLSAWIAERFRGPRVIALYFPAMPNRRGEADPTALHGMPILAEFHFAYPRIVDRFHAEMDFSLPVVPTDWIIGPYGSPESHPDLAAVDPRTIDLIVVPGVVFGARGERIGMGAGFYDRYLPTAERAIRVGFGFDFQLLDEPVPQSEWDARMDFVVTDRRIVETGARVEV